MIWPFEHHDDGEIHLHQENWGRFKLEREREYKHNWLHRRLFMLLHTPKNSIEELPAICKMSLFGHEYEISKQINFVSPEWSVVFEPYPAWHRTPWDKKAQNQSYHVWLEDKHPKPTYGDSVVLFSITTLTLNC